MQQIYLKSGNGIENKFSGEIINIMSLDINGATVPEYSTGKIIVSSEIVCHR